MTTNPFLNKIKIHFFKSIEEQEIELGLVNVLIGANGSGKSNILEAFGILAAAASGRVDDESLQRRGVRPGVPRLYKSAFGKRLGPHISFDAYSDKASFSVRLNNPLEAPRPAWLYKTEKLQLFSNNKPIASRSPRMAKNAEQGIAALKVAELEESNPAAQLMDILRNYAIYAPSTLMLRGLIPDPQSREPVGLGGGQLAEAVRQLLRLRRSSDPERMDYLFFDEAFDELLGLIDWAINVGVAVSAESLLSAAVPRPRLVLRFRDRYMREGKNILTAHDASEGALYVLFCAVLALLPGAPKCLAIDNLDQALNPRLTQKLVSLLCKWITENPIPRQLLFTAHNPAVLDGLPLHDDRIRLFAVDRNSQGHTVINRIVITDQLRRLSKDRGWPLSRLWVMGHLGGVPGGVYRWCKQLVSMLEPVGENPSLSGFDLILLHLDADVASEEYSNANINDGTDDLPCRLPCPPAADSVDALRQVGRKWLALPGHGALPDRWIFCNPSMCPEAWLIAALYRDAEPEIMAEIECNPNLENWLSQRPKSEGDRFVSRGKKIVSVYQEIAPRITAAWDEVCACCSQAHRFTEEVRHALT